MLRGLSSSYNFHEQHGISAIGAPGEHSAFRSFCPSDFSFSLSSLLYDICCLCSKPHFGGIVICTSIANLRPHAHTLSKWNPLACALGHRALHDHPAQTTPQSVTMVHDYPAPTALQSITVMQRPQMVQQVHQMQVSEVMPLHVQEVQQVHLQQVQVMEPPQAVWYPPPVVSASNPYMFCTRP